MNKKFIIVGVVILALAMLFVACSKSEGDETTTTTESTTEEITTDVDEKGAFVFNKDGEKIYLVDKDGFHIAPEDAVEMSPEKEDSEESVIIIGDEDTTQDATISFEEIK